VSADVSPSSISGARVAIGYDCFFPLTVGGAERWYRALSEALAERGAAVTYLTRRQWEADPPELPGVKLEAVSRADDLYDEKGVRKLAPGLRFGYGLFRYLLRHRSEFDLVHLGNFPYWSVIGARLALAGTGVPLIVDWHEIWSFEFWRSYVGSVVGVAGFAVERLCIALTPVAQVTSESNARRIRGAGMRREVVVLPGFLPSGMIGDDSNGEPTEPADPPYVLFAGRHIYDKGIDLLPPLAERLRRLRPEIGVVVAGGGPGTGKLEADLARVAPGAQTRLVGFVEYLELQRLMAGAACIVIPSRREGYGLVLVEASGFGTPAAVAGFEENLARDNIEPGSNGYVAVPPTPERLAEVIVKIVDDGMALRRSAMKWYRETAPGRTMGHSVDTAIGLHERLIGERRLAAATGRRSPVRGWR